MTATATMTEVLTPTRSARHRAIRWTPCGADTRCPCTGKLEITTSKKSEQYGVVQLGISHGFPPGLAFNLIKPDGELYSCLLADDRHLSTCDCAGWTYDATRKADRRNGEQTESLGCKHLDGILAIAMNGWFDLTNPEQDVTTTETE